MNLLRSCCSDSQINIRLEMEEYGWAKLHLTLDAFTTVIRLSEVFDPFNDLVSWGQQIDEGNLPAQMEIDEEGRTVVLTVLGTATPGSGLLRVNRQYSEEFMLQGVVTCSAFAASLKSELLRFFTSEFDPQQWHMGRYFDPEDGYIQTKDRVLNHKWFMP